MLKREFTGGDLMLPIFGGYLSTLLIDGVNTLFRGLRWWVIGMAAAGALTKFSRGSHLGQRNRDPCSLSSINGTSRFLLTTTWNRNTLRFFSAPHHRLLRSLANRILYPTLDLLDSRRPQFCAMAYSYPVFNFRPEYIHCVWLLVVGGGLEGYHPGLLLWN